MNALDALVTGLKEIANSIDFTHLHFSICRTYLILNFSQEVWNVTNKISQECHIKKQKNQAKRGLEEKGE